MLARRQRGLVVQGTRVPRYLFAPERLFHRHSSDVVEDDDDRKHPQAAVCRAVRSRLSPVPGVAVQDKGVDFRSSSDHDGV